MSFPETSGAAILAPGMVAITTLRVRMNHRIDFVYETGMVVKFTVPSASQGPLGRAWTCANFAGR